MPIRLNGEPLDTQAQTVAELLAELRVEPVGVAIAVNDSVVRRAAHASHWLREGDRVEIIRAVQGG